MSTNKKTAIAVTTAVVLAGISKMIMDVTKWESAVLYMLVFLCTRVLLEE